MPDDRRLSLRVTVRGYEMGADGRIGAAVLARYLEHARWEALRRPDYPLAKHFVRGVVRAQKIEVLAGASYPMELEILLWIGRVGRTSFDFAHRVLGPDGALVARAVCTAVRLDQSGKPAPLPEAFRELVVAGEEPDVPALDEAPPSGAFERRIVVCPSDLDFLQHVNHARYIDYANDTRVLLEREHGDAGTLCGAPVGKLFIEYRREARTGDRVRTLCWPVSGTSRAYGVELRSEADDVVHARARIEPRAD